MRPQPTALPTVRFSPATNVEFISAANTYCPEGGHARRMQYISELPIACTFSEDALRARRDGLPTQVAQGASRMTAIASGYGLEFDAKADVLPNLGPIILELTGPTGTQAFLEELLETS